MGSTDITRTSPGEPAVVDARTYELIEKLVPQASLASSVLRLAFTVAALVGLSALFATQLQATLH